jgi:RimJ/RimL family protein N-acetyltransferase
VSPELSAVSLPAGELRLDPLVAEDAKELAPLLDDPGLHEFIGGQPLSEAALEARYRRLVRGAPAGGGATWLNWTIRRQADGRAVGTAQATVTRGDAALAWVVAGAWQGRGYGTEAARALVDWAKRNGLAPRANIAPGHTASERVASRAGLRPSGQWAAGERVWREPDRAGRGSALP